MFNVAEMAAHNLHFHAVALERAREASAAGDNRQAAEHRAIATYYRKAYGHFRKAASQGLTMCEGHAFVWPIN